MVRKRPPELATLVELMAEQQPGAIARARSDPKGTSMTFIAQGEHIVLLVVRLGERPRLRRYLCKISEVEDDNDLAAPA